MNINNNCTDLDETLPYDYDVKSGETETQPTQATSGPGSTTGWEALTWRKSVIHCCWGTCKTDTRYYFNSPPGTFFIPFPKVGRFKDVMTEWERNREKEKTLKAKRWVFACGRKDFTLEKVKKDTYICSIHFVGGKGATEEYPDPIKATLSENDPKALKKRKAPIKRGTPTKKRRFDIIKCVNNDENTPVVDFECSSDISKNKANPEDLQEK